MTKREIPARGGLAVRVEDGERLRITTPKGAQAADFFAYVADDLREWLSPAHTWVTTRSVKPRPGDTFLSRFRRAPPDFVEDRDGGEDQKSVAPRDPARHRP